MKMCINISNREFYLDGYLILKADQINDMDYMSGI